MLKISEKTTNKILILITIAVTAFAAGILLRIGFADSKLSANSDMVAQAQENEAVFEKRSTATPSVAQIPNYVPESQTQQTQGINFTASNFYVDSGHVFADVCYDLPGNDVWDINMATLSYGGKSTSNFAVNEISINVANDNQSKGSRCLKLDFYDVEANSDFSTLTLIVGNIGQIAPPEGRECEGYLGRIQASSGISELGIEVTCEQFQGDSQVLLTKKPATMSDEEANALIAQAMYGQVTGPWEFTVTRNK